MDYREDRDNGNRKFVIHRGQVVVKDARNRDPEEQNDGISATVLDSEEED